MKIFLLILFWILWFLNFSSRTIISPIMPLIEDEYSINHAMAGVLFFIFWAGVTISVFSAGFISLRIGYKKTLLYGFLVLVVTLFLIGYAPTCQVFAIIAFFMGLGAGVYLPCAIPFITAVFERDSWGKAISFHETATGFSLLITPFVIVFALGFLNWKSIFLVMSGACLFVTILLFISSPDPRPEKGEKADISVILHRKSFWIMTAIWSGCAIANMGIYNILPLFLVKERGMQIESANTLFGISRVGGFIAMILIGFVIDKFNLKKMLLFLLFATGITTTAIALVHSYWLLSSMLFAQAIFSVVFFPASLVAIAKLTTLSERSVFTGILMSISGIIGPGLSPIILGAVADAWNFQIGIFVSGVIITLSCLLFRYLKEI
jgi:MFS family permease